MTTVAVPLTATDRALGVRRSGAVLAALAGVVLAVVSVTGDDEVLASTWVRAGLVALWAVTGLLLSLRGQARFGTVVAAAAAVAGICAATAGRDPQVVHAMAACSIPAAAFHLQLALPDGRVLRRPRQVAIVGAWAIGIASGLALAGADRVPSAAGVAVAIVVALLLGMPSAYQSYRAASGTVRQRLQLIGCATAVIVEVGMVVAALRLLLDWPTHGAEIVAGSTALVPLALAGGTSAKVSRRVDRLLVHTVSATGLTAVVVAVYVVIVIGLGRTPEGTERTLLVLSMLAAAVTSLAYVPARERLAETANRLVYGERHPPDEVLRTWGSRLSRSIPMDELLLQLAESLRKVMGLQRAEVWTGTNGRLELTVAVPDRTATPLVLGAEERPIVTRAGVTGNAWLEVWLPSLLEGRPLSQVRAAPASHSGELLGLLVMERANDDEGFAEEDERVLVELARQVGLALHNVELDSALQESLANLEQANADLQASRARIVATGDAERRKIERNLHDGAQQHLVALAVNLRLAKDIVAEDPEGAVEMLDALAEAVKETIQELRDLAHGIYPPLLMDSGIPEALRAAANRSPLSVSVEADGVGRHPSEVEAAVYFCCLEALQNAAKHAPEASVQIVVREEDGTLRFSVSDDGPGFDIAAATAGHGYVNMSDRLGAIGGTVDWRSAPGEGATISGELPL